MSTRTRNVGAPLAIATGAGCTCQIIGINGFKSPKVPNGVYSAGNYSIGSSFDIVTKESRSTITDVTGNRNGFNAVTHTRKSCDQPNHAPFHIGYTNPSAPFGSAELDCTQSGPTHLQGFIDSGHLSVPDGTLIARARVPVIDRSNMDAVVSLYELKDIAHLLGHIAGLLIEASVRAKSRNRVSVAAEILTEEVKDFVSSPGAFLKGLINGHLLWKFGMQPLIQDVHSVSSAIGRVDSKLRKLQKPFRVTGSYTYTKKDTWDFGWNVNPSTLGLYQSKIRGSRTTTVVWTEGALRLVNPSKLPQINSLRVNAVRDSLGLNARLSTIWAVVPKSFIADWIFPIGDFLEQFDGQQPSSEWFTTLNTWSTVKTTTTGSIIEEFAPLESAYTQVQGTSGSNVQPYEYSLKTFTRSALQGPSWNPATPFVPEPRLPSPAQWFTTTEVMLQTLIRSLKVKGRSSWA